MFHNIFKYKYTILLVIVILIIFTPLAIICLSGYLPASVESKKYHVIIQLKIFNKIICEYCNSNDSIFPKKWSDVSEDISDSENMYHKDPFTLFKSHFLESFSKNRIIIWSVGPNGMNDLLVQSERIYGTDEIVLVIDKNSLDISSNIYDYGLENDETSFKNPLPIS